ncbi:hypothetical protein SBRCBS47491_007160 [Sporothrix bragantina]|uniref:Myb-like DNA-binding domain-containing protein n=1 Tax=Sporothrix bragantina TaxID=671064 RepID=A0ABP0CAX4_9PEZI
MSDAANQDVAAEGTTASGFPDPTPQEAFFFYNMIKNMQNQPDIDWDGVATDSNFKNAAVAKKRFYQIKQKLGLDGRATPATKSPRKPRGCKAADGQTLDKKPTKVTKRRKATTDAVADSNSPPTQRRRVSEDLSDSGSEEHTSLCKAEDGFPGCLVVGFLKNEDNAGEDDSGI